MSSYAFLAIALLTSSLRCATSLKVIAGDTIDFQCVTEKRDSVEYLPNFERRNDDDSWKTLFVGSNPRPGTDLSKWLVSVDDASVFHYRLLNAGLEDGGHYRCENVNIHHHPLNVFSPVLDCGESRLLNNFVDDVQVFRPVCRVETSGPMTALEDDDAPSTLKWIVDGSDKSVKSKLTSNSSHVEATLTEDLTEDHHGKVISCVLDAGIGGSREAQEKPNCVLGPLNISFDVRVKSISDNHDDDNCHNYDLILTGNPSPILQFVTVEDSTGIVESGISYASESESSAKRAIIPQMTAEMPSGNDVEVRMRACDLESAVVAVVKYEGVEVTSVKFTASEDVVDSSAVDSSAVDSSAVGLHEEKESEAVKIVVTVGMLLLAGVVAAVAYYIIMLRKQPSKVVEDVETGEGSGAEEAKEEEAKEEEVEEVKEAKEEEVKEGEEAEEKKESKDEDEKKESKIEEVKSVEDSDAAMKAKLSEDSDADAALKAKLSVVEEAESDDALNAKLSALEDVEGVKMIDDSLNEGKEDSPLGDNVEV